jgi:hypothetical protein
VMTESCHLAYWVCLSPLGEGDGNFVDEVAGGEAALSFES